MRTWLAVGIGGALGSMARHAVNVLVSHRLGQAVPYATLAVNLAGCLAIGLLAGLVAGDRVAMTPEMRTFVFVGILGGFTTFSSFGLDTFVLAREGRHLAAILNAAGQVVFGLVAVAAGYFAGVRA
jgi:CrcB protein